MVLAVLITTELNLKATENEDHKCFSEVQACERNTYGVGKVYRHIHTKAFYSTITIYMLSSC